MFFFHHSFHFSLVCCWVWELPKECWWCYRSSDQDVRVLEDCQQTDNVEYGTELILPVKLFTAFSPTTMSRLHAICQTPTLTEPVKNKRRVLQLVQRKKEMNGTKISVREPMDARVFDTRHDINIRLFIRVATWHAWMGLYSSAAQGRKRRTCRSKW